MLRDDRRDVMLTPCGTGTSPPTSCPFIERLEVELSKTSTRWGRVAALAAVGVLMLVFWNSAWLWPLKLLVVMFHELGHAVAALLTGGEVLEISVSPDQGGFALTRGGNAFLILNAGYLGSLAAGVALLVLGRKPRGARVAAGVLSALLLTVTLIWVSWLTFGWFFALAAAVGLAVLTRWAPGELLAFLVRALGVFSVLYAAWDVRSDVLVWGGGGPSDAAMLAERTMVPAACWGVGWILAGVAVLVLLRKKIV